MIPTPDLSHLTKTDYDDVYEPAEDTFILLDALEHELEDLQALKPLVCLEIGSGSGCVSSFAGSMLGAFTALRLCTDINPRAAICTSLTGAKNDTPLDPMIASFANPLLDRLEHSVDLMLFNPPYVPTSTVESFEGQDTAGIQGSWAGGTNGMQITEHVFPQAQRLLSPRGRFYLVALKQNDVPRIRQRMSQEYGFESEIVLQRRAGREHLFVLRFTRSKVEHKKTIHNECLSN